MSPDINVLYKMRELWSYWQVLFVSSDHGCERDIKRLMKAKKYAEYEEIAGRLLAN